MTSETQRKAPIVVLGAGTIVALASRDRVKSNLHLIYIERWHRCYRVDHRPDHSVHGKVRRRRCCRNPPFGPQEHSIHQSMGCTCSYQPKVDETTWNADLQRQGAHHVYSGTDATTFQHKLEVDTFKKLWAMSEPGSDAEECFLRIDEAEYFHGADNARTTPLQDMPEACSFLDSNRSG